MRVDYIGNVILCVRIAVFGFQRDSFHEQLVLVPLCFCLVLASTSVRFPMSFHHWLCLNMLLYSVVGSDCSQVTKCRPLFAFSRFLRLHDLVNYHSILNTAPGTLSLNP